MKATTIGIDLAKEVFQVHGVNEHGKPLFNKQLKCSQIASFLANVSRWYSPDSCPQKGVVIQLQTR